MRLHVSTSYVVILRSYKHIKQKNQNYNYNMVTGVRISNTLNRSQSDTITDVASIILFFYFICI
jgi:hypothetical protein